MEIISSITFGVLLPPIPIINGKIPALWLTIVAINCFFSYSLNEVDSAVVPKTTR